MHLLLSLVFLASPLQLPQGSVLHLEMNIKSGSQLLLNDNSLWDIDPEDCNTSSLWVSPFPIKIIPSKSALYPYILINMQSLEKVKAKPSKLKD